MRPDAPPLLDPGAWLQEALHLLALRLRHEVALMRALRGDDRREQFMGLFLSDDEAEAMLDEMAGRLSVRGSGVLALDEVVAAWHAQAARRRADPRGIWVRLAQAFVLAEAELDLLVLGAAPALDPRFGRAYGYLSDDLARRHLTPALAQRLLPHGLDALTLRRMLSPVAPLRLFALMRAEPGLPQIEAPLRTEEAVIDLMLGAAPETPGPLLRLGREDGAVPDVGTVLVTAGSPDAVSVAALEAAGRAGWTLCLLPDHIAPEAMPARMRDARLAGAVPVLTEPPLDPAGRAALAPLLGEGAILLAAEAEPWLDAGLAAEVVAPRAAPALHADWMARLLGADAGAASRSRHADLLRLARTRLRADGGRAFAAEALRRAAEAQATAGLSRFARRIVSTQSLDDLVLPQPTRQALDRLIAAQGHAGLVLGDWGLGPLWAKGRGMVALFKGPSGTGKTMAAAIVGAALELPVFRIDLAAMVSKYIGETEKNLERLFLAAEGTDALLFFDEADSLFGQRSEVSDAHDRYANLETSYLLQRLESFDGLSVLATNLAQNMDPAFLRRFDHVIDFPAPPAELRRILWQRGLGAGAPVAGDADLDLLAMRFELTGAEIRNCWLDAAYRAAAQGRPIDMAMLMQAVASELQKQGKVLKRTDFGDHYAAAKGARA